MPRVGAVPPGIASPPPPAPPPRVAPPPPRPPAGTVPPRTGPPGGGAPYEHRFGSLPFYLFARFVAFLIDGVGVTFFLMAALRQGAVAGRVALDTASAGGFGLLLGIAFGCAFLLAFVCEAISGTTLGKLVFALHVRRRDGSHVGLAGVFVRTLLYPVDLPLVGLVLAALTPRRQRLGDLAGGTVVARSRIGGFASVLGIAVVVGLVYVQAAFLGGAAAASDLGGSALERGPGYLAALAGFFGSHGPTEAPPAPAGSPAAEETTSPAVESPEPSEAPSEEPSAPATETPSPPPAEPTDAPAGSPSDAPIARPSLGEPSDAPSLAPPASPPAGADATAAPTA